MTEQLSTPLKTLDSNLKDGTGAGQGSANFGPNRTASEVRVSFTLLSGWNKKVKRRILFHDTWKSYKIQIAGSKIKLSWDTTCLHLGIQNSLELSLFHTKYSVFGPLQQKFVALQSGIKTRNILVLEKETDFRPIWKVTKTKQMSHFPPNSLESALLCEGAIKNSRKQFPRNANLISIKLNHCYLESFWFQLTNSPSPSTHTKSPLNVFLRLCLLYLVMSGTIWVTHQMVYGNLHPFLNGNNFIIKNKHEDCF